MAGKVFFTVAVTLDRFIAPESRPEDLEALRSGTTTPGLKRWMAQWMELQHWAFKQRFFRENLKLSGGGEVGVDNTVLERTYNRTGASVMGKRMFDRGEHQWPEEAPFHTPVYVVTHEVREPWERPGGTTFHFVNDGIEGALEQARKAGGDRDVRIAGGAETILQYLNAGLVDEFTITLAPVFFGTGVRLFERVNASRRRPARARRPSSSQRFHKSASKRRTNSVIDVAITLESEAAATADQADRRGSYRRAPSARSRCPTKRRPPARIASHASRGPRRTS